MPAFAGKPLDRKEPIFWEHEGNRAVRDGEWKLVAKHDRPWELYDIDGRPHRSCTTSRQGAGAVKELAAAWDAWAKRVGVRPWAEVGGRRRSDVHSATWRNQGLTATRRLCE